MSILIKGLQFPKDNAIAVVIHPDGTAYSSKMFAGVCTEYLADCSAVPVPPHDGEAFEKVISERVTQIEKWGKDPCNHPFEWMSILGEEFGELCEAVNETCFMNGTHPERGGDENIIREATQIAAVAIAIIRDFSHTIIQAKEE